MEQEHHVTWFPSPSQFVATVLILPHLLLPLSVSRFPAQLPSFALREEQRCAAIAWKDYLVSIHLIIFRFIQKSIFSAISTTAKKAHI